MKNDTKNISIHDLQSNEPSYLETIFSLANGHFGIRASDPIANSSTAGTLVNGFYETSDITYGEVAYGYAKKNQTIVKLPDLRNIKFVDDQQRAFDQSQLISESLDFETGLLNSTYKISNPDGKSFELNLQAVLQQSNDEVIGLRYTIKPVDYFGKVVGIKHFNTDSATQKSDDPRKSRTVDTLTYAKKTIDGQQELIEVTTKYSQMSLAMAMSVSTGLEQVFSLQPNQTVTFDVIGLVSKINGILDLDNLPKFEEILKDSTDFWQEFWQNSDIEISGDDSLNQAIHYNLFQLVSSTGRDGKTNIPAKGLSGTGYEGHYFWDTEMYMSPFFAYTNPEIAKNLIKYRYSVLDESKKRARTLGVKEGALFSWRTINGQEASAYYPAGTAQYHIDADIAYAIDRYYKVTDDKEFMKNYGLELVLETARFWKNFGSYSEIHCKKRFCFFDVTGPDEYTALVNNNYYTNRMAKFNLLFAVDLIDEFPKKAKELGVSAKERDQMANIAAAIFLPYDQIKGINQQDDSSFKKPVWPFETTPKENYPLLLHYHPLTIYRYQVNKQADTLLADFLFDDISHDQLVKEYDYYEKITTHDSSLSRSIFSALAARIGLKQKAYDYFMATAKTDLIDLQGNSADGLHVANLGGSWLTIVSGFGGLRVKDGLLTIDNHLPDQWDKLAIRIKYQGRLLEIVYRKDATEIHIIHGEPLPIKVDGIEETFK
ncbi:maltose phosphorylase [Companilactobacillus mindensis DSM 14500]|uniref:Maltose phosphorylase n=1 Tax=Companilactobacillus mindensis DSM 14500 TaxID=1423770 RepID=A0A0R1QFV1_9LACO|nr:glycosyl hydrolase family 65 protein [Companilactobacillus mindensis]KRL43718.1 maltose phosphorylase [Companilactobacillus mindensis DSM 14500]GEO79509.1 maltose phosphorylase [Companilactobacillus mindensis]